MSRMQLEVTQHMKKQEKYQLKGKRQPRDTKAKVVQKLVIPDQRL